MKRLLFLLTMLTTILTKVVAQQPVMYTITPSVEFEVNMTSASEGTTVTIILSQTGMQLVADNQPTIPRVYFVSGEETVTVPTTKTNEGVYTFEMPASNVELEKYLPLAILELSADQKTLTFKGVNRHEFMSMQPSGGSAIVQFMQFYQGQMNEETDFTRICHSQVENVVIDESMWMVNSIQTKRLFYNFSQLKTITGLEYLKMTRLYNYNYGVSDLTEMFAGCSSLTSLSIDENFFVGPAVDEGIGSDATNMFYGCTGLANGVLYVNGTTAPTISQDVLGVFNNATLVVESEDLLTDLVSNAGLVQNNNGSWDWKGGHFNQKYIGQIPQTPQKTAITPTVSISGWAYGDQPSTPVVEGNTGSGAVTFQYKVKDADDNTYQDYNPTGNTPSMPTESGDYTLKVTIAETESYLGATATTDFTIAKADIAVNAITPPEPVTNLMYNRDYQDLITAGSCSFGEMQYSLDGTNYSTDIPKGLEAKEYTVYYKVVGDKNHNDSEPVTVSVTIAPETLAYAVLSDDGTTLTFAYGQAPQGVTYYNAYGGWTHANWNSGVTTVVFDESFANARPTDCIDWFKDFTSLTTVTGMEYLNTTEVTDFTNMFVNCEKLTQLTIGGNFYVGENATTSNMFMSVRDGYDNDTYLDRGTLIVKGTPTIKQNIFANVFFYGTLLSENDLVVSQNANGEISWMGGGFVRYNNYYLVKPEYGFITKDGNDNEIYMAEPGAIVSVSVDPNFQGMTMLPKAVHYDSADREKVSLIKNGEVWTFEMPQYPVEIIQMRLAPAFSWSQDQKTLTVLGVDSEDLQMGQQQQGMSNPMSYMMYMQAQMGMQQNEELTSLINALHENVETVVFDVETVRNIEGSLNGQRLFYGFSKLTTITGLEDLDMQNYYSMTEMFAGCSSLASLTVGSKFCVKAPQYQNKWGETEAFDTTDMFAGCTSLANGTLTVTGLPTIEQDIFSIITNGTLVTDPTDLLGELPTENGKYLWKGGKFNSFNGNTVKTAITPTVSISGWAYGDQPSTPVVEGNTGSGAVTFQYKVKDADDNTYQDYNPTGNTPSMPTESGDYTLKVTIAETESYLGATATTDFTIAKADIAVNAITPPEPVTNLMYNRDYQDLITAGSCSFGEMQYSLDGTNYSTDIPKGLEAKEYTVYYKVVGDKNHNDSEPVTVSVTIAPETLAYAVLSDDGTTLTFAYGQAPQGVTYYNAYGGWTHANWNSGVTTVVFDESFANARPTDCIDWFKDFTSLTTVTGMEYLNTTEVTDFTNMFVNCEKLTQLTIGGNFYVGENATTSNMFMSVRDGYDNDTYLDRGTLIVKGTPTIKQNIFANVFFYGTLLSENDLVVSQNANGEISWMGGGFVRYNNYYLVKPEYGFITKDGNDNEIYMAEPGAIVSVSVDPNFQGMTMLPKAVHYDSADREKVSLIKNGEVWTFEMPQYPVEIIQMRLAPAFSWSQDQKTLTVLGVDSEDLQMGQQQQGMSNPMSYMMYMQAQMGMQQNEELTSLINALHENVETVVFDETVTRLDRGLNGQRLLYGYKNLTTITGMENLGMQNFYSTNEMFAGCSSLTNLTIGSNFYIGAVNDGFTTDDMFTGCTGLAGGTLIIKRGAPNINQDIFTGVFTEGSLIFDPENIEGQLGNQVTTDNDGTKHYKGGIFTTNIEQPENGEVTAESTTVNGDTYVLLYIQPKEKYELTSVSVTYTDESGIVHDVEVTDVSNDTYIIKRFKMPKYSVKIVLVFTLKPENTTEQLSMEANKQWMTYYPSTNDLTLPDGLEAYYVSDVTLSDNGKTGSVTIVSTGNKLYKDVPALIHRTNSSTSALDITATGTRHNDGETIRNSKSANYLGTATDLNLANQANNNIFVLRDGAFIKANPSTIGAHRCWISLGGVSASRLVLRGSDETRIEGIMTVEKQTEWYDMHGRKLDTEPVRKGVYIQNGKKIVVK